MAEKNGEPPRKRARQACFSCNARRVKCDVTEQHPCRPCAANGATCEIRQSHRGRHPRRPKASYSVDISGSANLRDTTNDGIEGTVQNAVAHQTVSPSAIEDLTEDRHNDDALAASHVLASLSHDLTAGAFDVVRNNGESGAGEAAQGVPNLDIAGQRDMTINGFYSDARGHHSGSQLGMQRRSVTQQSTSEGYEAQHKKARLELLKQSGAFTLPPKPAELYLLEAYFRWFHPCFAVVDEGQFWHDHSQGTISISLLQAMLFVGAIHSDEQDLSRLGIGGRQKTKLTLYYRAKDLVDASYESDQQVVTQCLFLLSFRRANASNEQDARHWIAAAISSAQTRGLHRATNGTPTRLTRLRKRIWWSLFTREKQCAAALGLPSRIHDDFDIAGLEPEDFENAFSESQKDNAKFISYAIESAKLAGLLGKIIHAGYFLIKELEPMQRSGLQDELSSWKQSLPTYMHTYSDTGEHQNLHANMLNLAYNNLLILLNRSVCIQSITDPQSQIALQAAARNSRIVEDMLTEGNLRHAQIHAITNLFNTLCIHTISTRRLNGPLRAIAEQRAKICLLGLQELQYTWEVTDWALQLFYRYLDRSTAEKLKTNDEQSYGRHRAEVDVATPGTNLAAVQNQLESSAVMPGSGTTPDSAVPGTLSGYALASDTPWSWSTVEANTFLFAQIENDFAFGEGGVFGFSWDNNVPFLNADVNLVSRPEG